MTTQDRILNICKKIPALKELYDSIPNTYEEYVKFLYESIVSID